MTAAVRALLLVLAVLWPGAVAAQDAPPPATPTDQAQIGDNAGRGAVGRVAVNQAAGVGNAQANLAAIALSADGAGRAQLGARQSTTFSADDLRRAAVARIDGSAFAGGDGLLGLNQAAGAGNAQTNLFAIEQGTAPAALSAHVAMSGLDDAALAAVAGAPSPADGSGSTGLPRAAREARIGEAALRGQQGVLQVNQTAGVGNASTNAIVLQLPGGTP